MTATLNHSLNVLKANIIQLATELHANQTFEKKLQTIDQHNVTEMIILLVQFTSALNGYICNGQKIAYKSKIDELLQQLSEIHKTIQAETKLKMADKRDLSHFLNLNISSIGEVLRKSFNS